MLDALPGMGLDDAEPERGCYGIARPGWAVCHTHPKAERWADANLRRQGYTTYLPLYATSVRDRAIPSLRHTVHTPLFPNYLFIRLTRRDVWRPIRETPGVRDVIRTSDGIQYAPDAAVSALQALDAQRATPALPRAKWRPGAACSLQDGPLAGLPAVVLEVEQDQARIGVMFLGQIRQVSVAAECLRMRE